MPFKALSVNHFPHQDWHRSPCLANVLSHAQGKFLDFGTGIFFKGVECILKLFVISYGLTVKCDFGVGFQGNLTFNFVA
jgi:hypothetical protein